MANTEYFYPGAKYNLDSSYDAISGISETYGNTFLGSDFRYSASQFGFPTDPRTSNQVQAVSNKLSTGAKTIEVSGVSLGQAPMSLMDSIPKQQFQEINRLKKLVGVDLTFHGPLVEATGFQNKNNATEEDRMQAERQMLSAVRRGHELDPHGNIVVTFHSSNGLMEPETKILNEKGEEELNSYWIVDESGVQRGQGVNFQNIMPQINYLKKEKSLTDIKPEDFIEKTANEVWFSELQNVNYHTSQGAKIIESSLMSSVNDSEELKSMQDSGAILKFYKEGNTEAGKRALASLNPVLREVVEDKLNDITHGDIYLRSAYGAFQNLFNKAYSAAEKNRNEEDLAKLNKFRDEIYPKLQSLEEDTSKVYELGQEMIRGINVLKSIKPPQTFRRMRDWAIDQASTTFANVAFEAYKEFKNTAPIISIENPPAGSGLSRAEDLRGIVKEARRKFADAAMKERHLSKSEAQEQAEKLIGVTWDVGHINMLRGHGYKEEHIIKETEKVAELVKHVHLSDNFGLEHTELPMGMGNVPTKQMLELIDKYNKQAKKIVETGGLWFEHFRVTPFRQTMEAFGSSLYGDNMAPYWNQAIGASGGYFSGQGSVNPQIHHSMYGAGFANLPVELGGQMAGQSRASGAPIE